MNTDNTQDGAEPSPASAGSQPVAYEVWWDGAARQPYFVSADEKPSGNWTPAPRIVPLYRQPHPALTDEEREAVEYVELLLKCESHPVCSRHVDTLRSMLRRLG
jgi:hypothetical protein